MLSKWSWILFNLLVYVTTAPYNEETVPENEAKAFFELIELDYEDECYNIANVQWSFIVSPSNKTLSTWENEQYTYTKFTKAMKNEVIDRIQKNMTEQLKPSLRYKYDVIEKPGDTLLKDEDWKKFIHFAGMVELQSISHQLSVNKSRNYSREDTEYLLSHSGKSEDKQAAWNTWYLQFKSLVTNYSNNLPLVAEAAKQNGVKSVKEYWEMLSGYPGGYDVINSEWSRINTLHKKIVKFIGTNLARKYDITINDTIPAYLLGSLQGYDWMDISSDALPYSELIYDLKKNLWRKKYVGKSLYKIASNLGSILLRQVPQAEFWDKSEFNQQCPSRLLNFCRDGMRISTCSKASTSNFLTAHEDVGKILFNQMTVQNTPVLNMVNRYSGLEEGISTLFGILSASPAWLNHIHLINNTKENNEQYKIVSLMITALSILPRLAYYYSADLWRLNAIQENITDPAQLIASWWKYRQEYEGISSTNMDNPTFMNDNYIVRNKPYLPKILGTMLSFQLYEYTLDSTEVRYDAIDEKLMSSAIIKMIQHSGDCEWPDILNKFVEMDDISVDALLSYFTPLEEFIEENEEDFAYKSGAAADKELEELEKHILREINTPTTTPPPTTTTNRITTKASSYNTTSNEKNMQSKVEKPLESKSSIYMKDEPKDGLTLPTQVSNKESPAIPNITDNTQNDTPKINTSKAVWAVSAVLIAIVVICIIAIFGRRRCRKTPKNRRYV
ncbi:angiotensin-converting enzyme-like isoform X2 [Pogonomyrmex barbatus]|nr:angiotensin-converting enzyme-like isoform X2 [Pogonomyrmex barbatus]XP_011646804.1 angiotensin-converting enzyme-like isoform X2 [Pogonomyrmex barbatus]XP_011646805.1 angiotensin-converting enzyme-like isoform X2 [Pogonomyrmex barbatus]XP_011646806.1 angiotensin-converting enzyme-like isoform X2 [Pogonomyrmex barbatus]XP_011646807.1 angiotensin-converting enzyme-like isoform X2 [Pogonomyrmex barbatus]XP_011646808.1 angiotensin-converting enzyme-like isoform X2 [Pogonomyrmex barbatus]